MGKQRCSESRVVAGVLLGLLCCATGSAWAQSKSEPLFDPTRTHVTLGEHAILAVPGEVLLTFGAVSPISIGVMEEGTPEQTDWELVPRARARLTPSLIFSGKRWPVFQWYQVAVDIDARHVFSLGESPDYLSEDPLGQLRRDWSGPRVNQAYALMAGEHAAIKFGMTQSSWGTGLLANPGLSHRHDTIGTRSPPDVTISQSPFGYARFIDRVARLQLAFFPLEEVTDGTERYKPLTVAVAGDLVLEDATANWDAGDRTYQAIVAAYGRYNRLSMGLYGVFRRQEHRDDLGRTEVGVVDLSVSYRILSGAYDLWLDGELVFIAGESSYSKNVFHEGPLGVFQWGGVLRFGFASACFEAVLEFATSSGDSNPFDGALRQFNVNREFRAGLLMFREVLRITSAVGTANVADPTYRGTPPSGFERIATGGGIQGATLFFPRIAWEPTEGLKLYAGVLLGSSTLAYVDPFWTGVNGGVSSGPHGVRDKSFLGVEVDLAIRYTFEPLGPVAMSLMVEAAYFSAGEVFDRADGRPANDVFGAWAHAEARF